MPSEKRLSAEFSHSQFRLSGAGSALIQVSFQKSEKLVDLRVHLVSLQRYYPLREMPRF